MTRGTTSSRWDGGSAEGATTAQPSTKEEIEKLLAVAPRYGIEIIRLPGH